MVLNSPSVLSTLRSMGRNASAIPLVVAAFLTVGLSAMGLRPWNVYFICFYLWLLAVSLALFTRLLSLWIPRLRPGQWNGRLALGSLALGLSVLILNWPLYITFLVSRPALERIAADVQAGRTAAVPCHAGLFTIERAEIPAYTKMGKPKTGVVCLWTEYDRAGSVGFVQCAPDEGFFNIQSHIVLNPHWQFIAED